MNNLTAVWMPPNEPSPVQEVLMLAVSPAHSQMLISQLEKLVWAALKHLSGTLMQYQALILEAKKHETTRNEHFVSDGSMARTRLPK
ncbi:hypothetical protein LL947_10685 [Halomonas sp. BLK-85]